MKKIALLFVCFLFCGMFSMLGGCKSTDVDWGSLGIQPLGKVDSMSEWEIQYAKGDYAFFRSLSYSGNWSSKEKYLYLRALFHLKEWELLSQVFKNEKVPFEDPMLGPYFLSLALNTDIRNNDTASANKRYNTYLRHKNKFFPHLGKDTITNSYAAFLNDPSRASSKGGFHYYRYDQNPSRTQDFLMAVRAHYPDALQKVNFSDFKKAVPRTSWKAYLKNLKNHNNGVYLNVLENLGERGTLSEYYFEKARYSSALKYAPRGSFVYYASLLATTKKKTLTPDVRRYIDTHPQRIAYYNSRYEFTVGNYKNLKNIQTRYYAPRALRYLVVLGLNTQDPSEVLGTLEAIVKKFRNKLIADDKELALFWIAALTAKIHGEAQAQNYYMEVAKEFPITYYGSESLERLSSQNRTDLLDLWNKLSDKAREQEQAFINRINAYKMPNSIVLQRAMFFLRIREDVRGRKYLRELTEGKNTQSAPVAYALARQFYQSERMDYFAVYISRFFRALQKKFPHVLFYSDVLPMLYPVKFREIIRDASSVYDLDPAALKSLILQESWFDPMAKSWAGAQGLSQLMPATFASMTPQLLKKNVIKNEDVWDVHTNIFVGAAYLHWLMYKMYKDVPSEEKIIWSYASYNAGPGHIRKIFKDIRRPLVDTAQLVESIDYRETRNYAKKLIRSQRIYSYLRSKS